jgi:uncharacterized LabA/DUF88 family protein
VSKHRKSKATEPKHRLLAASMHDYVASAQQHPELIDQKVHIFVDDQNLFYGITNQKYGKGYRIDFGRLLLEACKIKDEQTRVVGSAYIAGVVPDDDSFWKIAENQGFNVKRGFLGAGGRSKQDDAYLIAEIVSAIHKQPGPSTIVLIAGDADYVPPLEKSIEEGWRNEIVMIDHGISPNLAKVVHSFREIVPHDIQLVSSM